MMETGSVVKETPSTYPSQLCDVVPPLVSWWKLALLSRKHKALNPASCVALFHHRSHGGYWLCCHEPVLVLSSCVDFSCPVFVCVDCPGIHLKMGFITGFVDLLVCIVVLMTDAVW